jgi:hypothetical protein
MHTILRCPAKSSQQAWCITTLCHQGKLGTCSNKLCRQLGDLNPRGQSPMDFKSIALTTRPSCRFHGKLRKSDLQIDGLLVPTHFSIHGGLVTGASAISHAPNINPPTFVSPTSVIIIQDIRAQEGQGQVNTVIISNGMFSPIVFTGFRFFPSFLRTPSLMI